MVVPYVDAASVEVDAVTDLVDVEAAFTVDIRSNGLIGGTNL